MERRRVGRWEGVLSHKVLRGGGELTLEMGIWYNNTRKARIRGWEGEVPIPRSDGKKER